MTIFIRQSKTNNFIDPYTEIRCTPWFSIETMVFWKRSGPRLVDRDSNPSFLTEQAYILILIDEQRQLQTVLTTNSASVPNFLTILTVVKSIAISVHFVLELDKIFISTRILLVENALQDELIWRCS